MAHERLRELLHRADAAGGAGETIPANMAEQIRGRVHRRRRLRIVSASGVTGFAITGLVALLLAHHSGGMPPSVVKELPKRPVPAITPLRTIDGSATLDPVADARNESACTMVVLARRRVKVLGPEDAAEVYRRTISLFPETAWAVVARKELSDLSH